MTCVRTLDLMDEFVNNYSSCSSNDNALVASQTFANYCALVRVTPAIIPYLDSCTSSFSIFIYTTITTALGCATHRQEKQNVPRNAITFFSHHITCTWIFLIITAMYARIAVHTYCNEVSLLHVINP